MVYEQFQWRILKEASLSEHLKNLQPRAYLLFLRPYSALPRFHWLQSGPCTLCNFLVYQFLYQCCLNGALKRFATGSPPAHGTAVSL